MEVWPNHKSSILAFWAVVKFRKNSKPYRIGLGAFSKIEKILENFFLNFPTIFLKNISDKCNTDKFQQAYFADFTHYSSEFNRLKENLKLLRNHDVIIKEIDRQLLQFVQVDWRKSDDFHRYIEVNFRVFWSIY